MSSASAPPSPSIALDRAATVLGWTESTVSQVPGSSRQHITDALREAIVSGRIRQGEQLKQDVLSQHFRVSPAPVREALRQLESEGLVQLRPNRGAFVMEVTGAEALGMLLPIRVLLEGYALSCLPRPLNERLVSGLEAQIDAMVTGADAGDIAMINEADVRFHEMLVDASNAPHTIQLWRSVLPRIRLQFYSLTPRHADLHSVAEEHRVLLRTLQKGDERAIRMLLQEHIVGAAAALIARNDGTQIPPEPRRAPTRGRKSL